MNKSLHRLYKMICTTTVRVLDVDLGTATKAVGMYLKNTASRAASKKHKEASINNTRTNSMNNSGRDLHSSSSSSAEMRNVGEEDIDSDFDFVPETP